MPELAYVNGVFGSVGDAKISIEDRGFQFGDAVYEVIVAYGGRLFLLEPHMQRLRQSAAAVGIEYDFDGQPLEPILTDGFRRSGFSDAMIYVQLTRGVAPRSHDIPEGMTPTIVMTFKALPPFPNELRERGARVMTTLDIRWANCHIKAVTLLPNVLAKNEALRRGYDDALFITPGGEVRECTSSNVFVAEGGKLKFPPRTEFTLHGVTQEFLLECAASIGVNVSEQAFDIEALRTADEVFMSGTMVEAFGITSIDGQPIGNGEVGPITRRIFEEFQRRVRNAIANRE